MPHNDHDQYALNAGTFLTYPPDIRSDAFTEGDVKASPPCSPEFIS